MTNNRHWIMAWLALALVNTEAATEQRFETEQTSFAWMGKADLTFGRRQ